MAFSVVRVHLCHEYNLMYGYDDMGGSLQKKVPKIVNVQVYSDKIQIDFQKKRKTVNYFKKLY